MSIKCLFNKVYWCLRGIITRGYPRRRPGGFITGCRKYCKKHFLENFLEVEEKIIRRSFIRICNVMLILPGTNDYH